MTSTPVATIRVDDVIVPLNDVAFTLGTFHNLEKALHEVIGTGKSRTVFVNDSEFRAFVIQPGTRLSLWCDESVQNEVYQEIQRWKFWDINAEE
ncbi:MAG: hypothetical protein LBH13_06460 [Cellulomonadaceae bacterium]|jgi:hypothetical protein|nr:hypothetical protein [Cellulomonadaceae bacterium]